MAHKPLSSHRPLLSVGTSVYDAAAAVAPPIAGAARKVTEPAQTRLGQPYARSTTTEFSVIPTGTASWAILQLVAARDRFRAAAKAGVVIAESTGRKGS